MTAISSGILLFAHGARDPRWADPFQAVADRIRSQVVATPVRLAFLEFMTPDLVTAGKQLVEAGCQRISIAPMFLGAGGHVRKDLPVLLEQLRAEHPTVQWDLLPAIGEMPSVCDAMAAALVQATQN